MQKCHFDLKLQFWRDRALAEGWWPTSIWSCQYKLEVISRGSNSNLLSNQSRTATPDMLLFQIGIENAFWKKGENDVVWTYPISQNDIVCWAGKFNLLNGNELIECLTHVHRLILKPGKPVVFWADKFKENVSFKSLFFSPNFLAC